MKPKIVLNRSGIHALLNSPEVSAEVERLAAQTAMKAGEGYKAAAPHHTGQRVAVNVYPASDDAYDDNYDHDTLLKVVYR